MGGCKGLPTDRSFQGPQVSVKKHHKGRVRHRTQHSQPSHTARGHRQLQPSACHACVSRPLTWLSFTQTTGCCHCCFASGPAGSTGKTRSARGTKAHAATHVTTLSRPRGTESLYECYNIPYEEITEEFLWRERLEPVLHYLTEERRCKVREALSLAHDAHQGQNRKSGEPFITHPVEVTRILAELQMDYESLCAGLLHDTVEDTEDVSFEEIEMWFGVSVRKIVEGETRFSKIGKISQLQDKQDAKAVDLQQLFLAMTEESRIIVVKLADRLHNMRTLGSMKPEKQKKIAAETLQIFAPLARLLGLYVVKEELEDLSFRYTEPEAYAAVTARMEQLAQEQEAVVAEAQQTLQLALDEDPYLRSRAEKVLVTTHRKAVYSVHRKLKDKGCRLDNLQNIAQLRIIIHMQPDLDPMLYGTGSQLCYHVMGLVHTKWAPIPGTIKDYIATPKANGYQSLHTTVLPLGSEKLFPLELQIRTAPMHQLAEYGIAGENWVAANVVGMDTAAASSKASMSGSFDSPAPSSLLNAPSVDGSQHTLTQDAATLSADEYAGSSTGNGAAPSIQDGSYSPASGHSQNGNGASPAYSSNGGVPSTSYGSNGSGRRPANSSNGTGRGMLYGSNGSGPHPNSSGVSGSHTNNGNGTAHSSNGAGSSGLSVPTSGPVGLSEGLQREAVGKPMNGKSVIGRSNGVASLGRKQYGSKKLNQQMMERRVNWLQSIRVWQEEFVGTITAREFVDCVTDDLLGRGVFVFTPAGEVMRLPKGSTVLDFAYHVHTDLGNKMIGAKVNGKPVPPDHQLANAEVVEILIYDGQLTKFQVQQHESWLAHAQTRSARHKLLKYLKDNEYLLNPEGLRNNVAVLERTRDPRQASLLHSRVSMDEIEFASAAAAAASAAAAAVPDAPVESAVRDSLGPQNKLASHPIQTDNDCDSQTAQEVPLQPANTDQQTQSAVGTWIVLECHDRAGVLAEVAQIIADHGSNISTYSGSVEKCTGMFRMRFQVQGSAEQTVAIKNAICSSKWVTMCDLE